MAYKKKHGGIGSKYDTGNRDLIKREDDQSRSIAREFNRKTSIKKKLK